MNIPDYIHKTVYSAYLHMMPAADAAPIELWDNHYDAGLTGSMTPNRVPHAIAHCEGDNFPQGMKLHRYAFARKGIYIGGTDWYEKPDDAADEAQTILRRGLLCADTVRAQTGILSGAMC